MFFAYSGLMTNGIVTLDPHDPGYRWTSWEVESLAFRFVYWEMEMPVLFRWADFFPDRFSTPKSSGDFSPEKDDSLMT